MEARLSASLGLPSPDPNQHLPITTDFSSLFTHFTTLTTSNQSPQKPLKPLHNHLCVASTSVSAYPQSNWLKRNSPESTKFQIPLPFANLNESKQPKPKFSKLLKPTLRNNPEVQTLVKNLSVFERALIDLGGGGIAGAFTYVCLHPLDTIKTKMQTKGASEIFANTFDAIVKTFQTKGILGFYRGVSVVIMGSTASSVVYFGTCEFGKSLLSKLEYPTLLIPPTAGAMGNIVSSAIMVPKELITQRMQAGAKGRSWEVLLRILEKVGILDLSAGYSVTMLRNLPPGVLSYSSFEYLKALVLSRTEQTYLEPFRVFVAMLWLV